MEQSSDQGKKKIYKVKTFPVPLFSETTTDNVSISIYNISKPSKQLIINQAFKFHSQGNISEAVKYYQQFIDQGFEDHIVFSNYGTILQDLGKLKEAEISYRKAIEICPNYAKAHSNLGTILGNLGKLKDAEISQNKAIELNPDFTEAHYNLGIILQDLGKLDEAELSTRKAIELNPSFTEAHYNLGNVLRDLGKLDEAELSTRKAIELKPDYAEAHYNLGNVLRDLGKLDEAELSYRKAIELKPQYAYACLNLGLILKDRGNLQDAELATRKAIKINPNFAKAHYNLGNILKDLGNLQEAELSIRKAIKINPDFAEAHCNLGNILSIFGNLKDAEVSYCQAIELNPNLTSVYYALSKLNNFENTKKYKNQIFSKTILNNKIVVDQVNIYFARANFLHKEKNYNDSAKYLKLANKLKITLEPFNSDLLINKSQLLLLESDKELINKQLDQQTSESIFIVGMPRSGSTLVESILSINPNVNDLGEINILEDSFLEQQRDDKGLSLYESYLKKTISRGDKEYITTNKWLFNYQYAGIISSQIPNAKIIHCYRNPLDNILSIYRTHFATGNKYSSSLIDCARVYLDQEEIMSKYKNRFRSNIYDLNYDSLVSNPDKEIKSLINWLGWEWEDSYLTPHLNPRSVLTASNVQVRSPINSKSIGGWKNYKDMLKPAIEILTQTYNYQDISL